MTRKFISSILHEATKLPDAMYSSLDAAIEQSGFWLQSNTESEGDMETIPHVGSQNQTPAAQVLGRVIEDYLASINFPMTAAVISAEADENEKLDLPVRSGHKLYPSDLVVGGSQGLSSKGRFVTYLYLMPVSEDYDLSMINGSVLSKKIGNIMRHEIIHSQQFEKRRKNQKVSRNVAKDRFEAEGEIPSNTAPRKDYLSSKIEIDAYAHELAEELLQKVGKEKALEVLRGKININSLNLSDQFIEYFKNVPGEDSTIRLKKKMYSHIMDLTQRGLYDHYERVIYNLINKNNH